MPRQPDLPYTATPTSVTVELSSHTSRSFTMLMKNLERIDKLTAELTELRAQTKMEFIEEELQRLFDVEDEMITRCVKTKSFAISVSIKPKPTAVVPYAKVVKALREKMTPELIAVLEELIKVHTTYTQKTRSLSYQRVSEAIVAEGVFDKIVTLFKKFWTVYDRWAGKYDQELRKLERSIEQ